VASCSGSNNLRRYRHNNRHSINSGGMEFPAVSHTRVEFWQERHYTRNGMWYFTLFFGLFGLHHLILKSPQTALIMVIANIFLLGYPWLYDLVQLSSGGLGEEELNLFGMAHPFGPLGLAKGMWASTCDFPSSSPYKDLTISEKPWTFFMYCLLCPIGIIGSLIVGDYSNAIARFMNIFPLGFVIVGYLFEIVCVICDIFIVLFKPVELIFGIKRPFFFRTSLIDNIIYPGLTMDKDGHSPRLMPVYYGKNISEYSQKLKEKLESITMSKEDAAGIQASIKGVQKIKIEKPKDAAQAGGGEAKGQGDKSPLDYFALTMIIAVIGGGLLLSGGRSPNGFTDRNDTPPKPRDV